MPADKQTFHKLAPAGSASPKSNRSISTPLVAATPKAAVQVPDPPTLGGCWMSFTWWPTVDDEPVRLSWGATNAHLATATDRLYPPYQEHTVFCNSDQTWWSGLSTGGGELSWNRDSG